MSTIPHVVPAPPSLRSRFAAAWDGDVMWSFRHSRVAVGSFAVLFLCLVAAFCAPLIAPHNPFDLATLNLSDALPPPRGMDGANPDYLLDRRDENLAVADLASARCPGRSRAWSAW